NDLTATEVTGADPADGFVRKGINSLRKTLNKNDVPTDGRILVVGVDVEEHLLNDPQFTRANEAGDSSALRNAELGRISGFRVVVSNTLDENRMVAFHPSAFTLVTRAPQVPTSVKDGRSEAYAGVALRAIKDYNSAV